MIGSFERVCQPLQIVFDSYHARHYDEHTEQSDDCVGEHNHLDREHINGMRHALIPRLSVYVQPDGEKNDWKEY